MADTEEECSEAVHFLSETFSSLGFKVHPDKSVLAPQRKLKFLGYFLDSTDMSVTPTVDKVVKARERINNLLKQSSPKIREVASVIGFLNDLCKAKEYGMLYTKNLEREKICALHVSGSR